MKRVGIDVGGTHTDLVLVDEKTDRLSVFKVPTSVDDPARASIEGLQQLCEQAGCGLGDLDYFMHGTTIATNIVLERNGAKTGLITTHGFRDILHIARHKRPQTFSLQLDLPWQKHPMVPRRRRFAVHERVTGPRGDLLVPLDEDATRAAVRKLRDQGVEAISVCFMFAFLNPVNEIRAREIIQEEAPDVFVTTSHEVVPQYREYERFSTTTLNAFVGPRTSAYLEHMDARLREGGLTVPMHLMQSSGGCATVEAAARKPVNLLLSGPVGGLLGGIWCGKTAGSDSVITLDVGGTSADIGVAPSGQVQFKHLLNTKIGDYHAMVPMAEVDAIGAGGGSIAYIDAGGQFQVGPKSAGANPGPACYGLGGSEPTATDCLVSLGWIAPDRFLGGRLKLDAALARDAVRTHLADRLGCSIEEAAIGAVRILTHNMVQAIEVNSVRRGYDPRDFALVAFGGAGALFATSIATELSIPKAVIPTAPGLTSALGLLTSNVSYDRGRTVMTDTANPDIAALDRAFADLENEAMAQLERDGFSGENARLVRYADCRYLGQGYELRAEALSGPVDDHFIQALRSAFDVAHQRAYGSSFEEKPVQIVNARVVAIGLIPTLATPAPASRSAGGPDDAIRAVEPASFWVDGGIDTMDTPRYQRDGLAPGHVVQGPAIIEQMDTTTVIPPGFSATVDVSGNLIIPNGGAV